MTSIDNIQVPKAKIADSIISNINAYLRPKYAYNVSAGRANPKAKSLSQPIVVPLTLDLVSSTDGMYIKVPTKPTLKKYISPIANVAIGIVIECKIYGIKNNKDGGIVNIKPNVPVIFLPILSTSVEIVSSLSYKFWD